MPLPLGYSPLDRRALEPMNARRVWGTTCYLTARATRLSRKDRYSHSGLDGFGFAAVRWDVRGAEPYVITASFHRSWVDKVRVASRQLRLCQPRVPSFPLGMMIFTGTRRCFA